MAVDRTYYTQRAVAHGRMATYYLRNLQQLVTGRDSDEAEIKWAEEQAVDEAREAWHYALLVTPGWTESELMFRTTEQRHDEYDDDLLDDLDF